MILLSIFRNFRVSPSGCASIEDARRNTQDIIRGTVGATSSNLAEITDYAKFLSAGGRVLRENQDDAWIEAEEVIIVNTIVLLEYGYRRRS